MSELDINNIIELLPHRYPLLLVDRVVSFEDGEKIWAYKNVTFNEEFFQGHFPGEPVMPGVLILEALAQAGGILFMLSNKDEVAGKSLYFFGIDKAKFRKPVTPGDRLDLKVDVIQASSRAWKLKGRAYVDDTLVAEALLTAGAGPGR